MSEERPRRRVSLTTFEGTVDRGTYAFYGVVLALIKYNIDRLLSASMLGTAWYPQHYFYPPIPVKFDLLSQQQVIFYETMLLLAVPFIWFGTSLTVRRLRDAGLNPSWILLFFVPVLNLISFFLLSVLPSAADTSSDEAQNSMLYRMMPESALGSAALGCLLSTILGLAVVLLSTAVLETYGWGLFVGIPFLCGLLSALLHNVREPRSTGQSVLVGMSSVLVLGTVIFGLAIEGVVCLLMAAPIGFIVCIPGALLGKALSRTLRSSSSGAVCGCFALFLPVLMGLERTAVPEPELFEVKTSIVVNAPPEEVWQFVIEFPKLDVPSNLVFAMGIAYPTEARIEGEGVGAVRYCTFSTGSFVEPIERWEPPHLLEFSVAENPPPMEEWSVYSNINAPHLDFMSSRRGRFRIDSLSGGRSLLEGTTWYQHRIWPSWYWKTYSDFIIHQIHLRVLRHVAIHAEAAAKLAT
ncbi:MAG: DUF805 domain-containing protein [Bdellovibrionales bacterium]|nr:DUF805 domain-containing protein [Bdellovibrionales bacterium]